MVIPLTPPSETENISAHADWLELIALTADDSNSSRGDLEQVLRRSGTFESAGAEADDKIDSHCVDVFALLTQRSKISGSAYPFKVTSGVITRKNRTLPTEHLPYVFCLCVSYFTGELPKTNKSDPRLMFEEMSCYALAAYIGGDYFLFGTGRSGTTSRGFKDSVKDLCNFLDEGIGFREQDTLHKQDDHLDIVAIQNFPDSKRSKLIVFGQCATGKNWTSKILELHPKIFCDQWMSGTVVSPLMRSFLTPHVIADNRWDYYARQAGLLFDRTRVSCWASKHEKIIEITGPIRQWLKLCLPASVISKG